MPGCIQLDILPVAQPTAFTCFLCDIPPPPPPPPPPLSGDGNEAANLQNGNVFCIEHELSPF